MFANVLRWRYGLAAATTIGMIVALQACKPSGQTVASSPSPPILSGRLFTDKQGELSPELRGLIKRGTDYQPIGGDSQALFDKLQGSMAERRKVAWSIVEKLIAPQTVVIDKVNYQIPLWHTWYEGSQGNPEFYGKIDLFYAKMNACKQAEKDKKCPKSYDELAAETMNDNKGAPQSKNLASTLTDANMKQTLAQLAGANGNVQADALGTGFTLFSPSFVQHVLAQSKGLMNCEADYAKKYTAAWPAPSDSQFSPCMTEFPTSAVMVKALWSDESQPNVAHDTTASGLTALFGQSAWPAGKNVPFDASKMYTVETKEGTKFGLRSIHFSTKDVREWIWISLWWDPEPNTDFGADRPASIKGVWANYKMCVTTSFNERDPAPWKSYEASAPSLAAALKANYDSLAAANIKAGNDPNHLTTWCTNPNIEVQENNNVTNCIGCHQYAGSWSTRTNSLTAFDETFAPDDKLFPQQGRDRARNTFLTDFAWGVARYEQIPRRIRTSRTRYGIAATE